MRLEDLILVSVDDHVVEPPDVFEHHLPAKYRDIAPRVEHRADGTDAWKFLDFHIPNVGLNAVTGRPPEEYGMDPTSFDELRKGTYDVNERVLDMSANGLLGSLNFPSLPGFAGRLFGQLEDKDAALALCRAYNDWHIEEWCGYAPERFIPLAIPPIWDPQAIADEVRRVAKKGCHAITFPENPVPLGLPEPAHRPLGPGVAGVLRRRHRRVHAHRLVGQARDHRARRADRRADQPPADEHRAGRGRHPVLAADHEVPRRHDRAVGGRDRLDPLLPRAHRPQLQGAQGVDASPTSAAKLPSEVFMERMILCFIEDDFGARQAREIGTDRICIETDYPHSDAVWPNAPERMMEAFAPTDLTDDEINQITHLNAMKFFQYDPFKIRPREKCTAGALRAEAVGHDISIVAKGRRVEHDAPTKVSVFGA